MGVSALSKLACITATVRKGGALSWKSTRLLPSSHVSLLAQQWLGKCHHTVSTTHVGFDGLSRVEKHDTLEPGDLNLNPG